MMQRTKTIVRLSWQALGSLAGIAAISGLALPSAVAQTQRRPGIFDEAPYNRAPKPVQTAPGNPLLPPNPEPVVTIQPVNGRVSIKLANQTTTEIAYQVVGDTPPRRLAGKTDITLLNLRTQTNLTFYRPDRGFILVELKPSATSPEQLEVSLSATADPNQGKNSLVIDPSGQVYLY